MLPSGTFSGYQFPLCLVRSGHIIPHEMMAPRRVEIFTRCETSIPAPTYVRLKSKKKLIQKEIEIRVLHVRIYGQPLLETIIELDYVCLQAFSPNVGN
jgi:hypothetical protein